MTNQPTDPRRPGGRVLGPDDSGHVRVDIREALLVDASEVMRLGLPDTNPAPVVGVRIGGVINTAEGPADERADVLCLMNGHSAAILVAQLVGLAYSLGPQFDQAFTASVRLLLAEGVPARRPYYG